jgi:hypothetical protein
VDVAGETSKDTEMDHSKTKIVPSNGSAEIIQAEEGTEPSGHGTGDTTYDRARGVFGQRQ